MFAQTVYVALTAVTVGVPVIAQVPVVRLNPVGRAGEIPQVAPDTAADGNMPVSRYVFPPLVLLLTAEGLIRSEGLLNPPLSPT